MRRLAQRLIALMPLLAATPMCGAQIASASRITVSAGSATDLSGVRSNAMSVAPHLSLASSTNSSLALLGNFTSHAGERWSAMGGLASALRESIGPVGFTVSGNASYTGTSYDVSQFVAAAAPVLELSAGAVTVFGGARASYAVTSATSEMPGGLPGAPRLGRESASRKGTTALYGAQLNLHALIGAPVALAYREERGSVAQYATSERMVTARISAGRTSVQGHAASHVVDGQSTMAMGGALSQAVTDIISVEAAVGSYPANPLTGTSAGRYVNAGLSLRFSARAFRMPRAEGAPSLIDGWTRVAIETRRAQSVELAGDFTNWQFWSARRASNGVWYVDLDIPEGQYRYAFRINGTQWRIPDGAPAADDEFGGESAWLKVDRRPD